MLGREKSLSKPRLGDLSVNMILASNAACETQPIVAHDRACSTMCILSGTVWFVELRARCDRLFAFPGSRGFIVHHEKRRLNSTSPERAVADHIRVFETDQAFSSRDAAVLSSHLRYADCRSDCDFEEHSPLDGLLSRCNPSGSYFPRVRDWWHGCDWPCTRTRPDDGAALGARYYLWPPWRR